MGFEPMRGLRAAVALLTRVPVGGRADWAQSDLNLSVKWIPVVGGLIGLVVAVVYLALASVVPALLASGVAVAAGVILTGAFHEDGLADTVDGFGGGADRDEVMRIMKDPTHGTFGVIALVMSLILRIAALSVVRPALAIAILPAVHALSRAGSIGLMAALPPATGDGSGAAHATPGLPRRVGVGALLAFLIGIVTVGWWAVAFALLIFLAAGGVGIAAARRIQGFTGDVLGAGEQVGEVIVMVFAAVLVSTGGLESLWWQ
jgi:adenosylcobinamide-GDP ribazoletransferase